MSAGISTRMRREARAKLDRTIERVDIGEHHYIVTFPIIVEERRRIEVFTRNGLVLDSSNKYLSRVFGKPFRAWLNFAFDMYQYELYITEVKVKTKLPSKKIRKLRLAQRWNE